MSVSAPRAASRRPDGIREQGVGTGQVLVVAAALLAGYVATYPLFGLRVPLGSDTPVYVWWARLAGAAGFGPLGSGDRPGTVGTLATLATVTRQPVSAVAAAIGPALATAAGLATAAFAERALGPDRWRFPLVGVFVGTYLAFVTDGYLSTVAFLAMFVGAMACLASGPGRAGGRGHVVAAGALLAGAGLAHPLFLALGAGLSAGGLLALAPSALRERAGGAPLAGTAAARLLAAWVGALVAAVGVLAASAGAGPAVDTSRDGVLRQTHLGRLLRASYVFVLESTFPWWRDLALLLAAVPPLALLRRRWRARGTGAGGAARGALAATLARRGDAARLYAGVLAAWLVISAGGVALLFAGTAAPGQRLAATCLAVPSLLGIAVAAARRAGGGRRAAGALAAGALLFVGITWGEWLATRPPVPPSVAGASAALGRALGATAPGTPLVVVMDDLGPKPALWVTRYENDVRAAVPPDRIPDVHFFVGRPADLLAGHPSLTGSAEHDRLAEHAWASVRPLLDRHPLVVAVRAFDAAGERQASALPGSRPLAPGIVALPGLAGRPAAGPVAAGSAPESVDPGQASPWEPVWLAPVLFLFLWVAGRGAAEALPDLPPGLRAALAPALGLALTALASTLVGLSGLRLRAGGGPVAAALALAGGAAVLAARRGRRAAGAEAG